MKLSSPKPKKLLYFLKKSFSYILRMEVSTLQSRSKYLEQNGVI